MAPSDPDRYALGDEIARGGMGAIVRAHDRTLNREVAVKILLDKYAPDGGAARRFADEAKITGQLQHPGIPPVYDLGALPDGRPFLAMKLIKGDTLDDRLKQRSDPGADRGELVAAFESICQAVGYAHAHGVVHRDLKPANVMVGAFGEVQVMDWGLAKVLGAGGPTVADDPEATTPTTAVVSDRDSDDLLTRAGSVLGTPAYMPPEQAIGAVDQIDRRSDVFGLGGILAAVMTGRPPFVGDTAESTRQLAAQGKLSDCFARLDASGADPELVALCKRCLAPDKADRPADAGAVATAVHDLRAAADERARQAELARAAAAAEAREQRKRRRVQLALAAAVVLLVAGASGVAAWRVAEDAKQKAEADRLAGEDRLRKERAADAVSSLLDLAEAALADEDMTRSTSFLSLATRRAEEELVAKFNDRIERDRRAMAVLRKLLDRDAAAINPVDGLLQNKDQQIESWLEVMGEVGIHPGVTHPKDAAAIISSSPIRGSLVGELDAALNSNLSPHVQDILRVVDPDEFRTEVRQFVVAKDRAALANLLEHPKWPTQPVGLIGLYFDAAPSTFQQKRRLMLEVVRQRPSDFRVLILMGSAALTAPNVTVADRVQWFRAAVAVRPDLSICHLYLAHVLREAGDLQGAVVAYKEAARLDPRSPTTHNNLGLTLSRTGDSDGAIAAYRESIRLAPQAAPPHNNLGYSLLSNRDVEGAIVAFREALRLEPNYPASLNGLGTALRSKGDEEGAIRSFRQAIALNPKYALALNNLGQALQVKGEVDGAIAAYREALLHNPRDNEAHDQLRRILVEKGDLDGALAAAREGVRFDPNNPWRHTSLARVLAHRGELGEALKTANEAVRLNPKNPWPYKDVGDIQRRRGEPALALAAYRQALRVDPKHPDANDCLDELLCSLGKYEEAAGAFQAALGVQPSRASARAGFEYALRAQRGEVPTAPPPRAVGR